VAIQAAREGGTSTLSALQEVVGLRELGASWIIVVARWELYTRAILTALSRVAGLIASQLVPVVATGGTDSDATTNAPGSSGGTTSGGTTSPGGSSSPPDGGTDPGDGGTDPGDGGTDPGGGGGGDRPTCGSDVECAVEDVVGETGGLTDDLGLTP
jgi:hypothetical protein